MALVAALAALAPPATFAADCPPTLETTVAACVPVTSPASEPEKLLADAAVVALVAEVALPDKLAVIVPAEKLPEASRFTSALGVFALVAALAALAAPATLAADCPPTLETTVEL